MRDRLCAVFAAVFAPLVAIYFLMPTPTAHDVYYAGLGLLAVAAMVLGLALNRPRPLAPFVLLVVGIALMATGDNVWAWYEAVLHTTAPYPSVADAVFLLAYPALFAGTALLVRDARDRRGVGLEAWIIASGAAVLVWEYLMAPAVSDTASPLLARLVSAAYPAVDLLLLAIVVRLLLLGLWRNRSLLLVCAGFGFALVGDSIYGVQALTGAYETGVWNDALWLAEYGLLAMAMLQPSVRGVTSALHANAPVRLRPRLVALAVAGLVAPVVLATEWAVGQDPDLFVVTAIWAVLFLLVVVRMRGLMVTLDLLLRQMRHRAHHDSLTGLKNRYSFTELVEASLVEPRPAFAVCYLDLDGFKQVNDEEGHLAGDALLVTVAGRLRGCVRTGDVVARLGGDEFAVYSPDVRDARQAWAIVDRLRSAMSEPFSVDGTMLPVGVSVGVALARPGDSFDELVSRADAAMYRAKQRARGTPAHDERTQDRSPVAG